MRWYISTGPAACVHGDRLRGGRIGAAVRQAAPPGGWGRRRRSQAHPPEPPRLSQLHELELEVDSRNLRAHRAVRFALKVRQEVLLELIVYDLVAGGGGGGGALITLDCDC